MSKRQNSLNLSAVNIPYSGDAEENQPIGFVRLN
jgi:hypothetical protein